MSRINLFTIPAGAAFADELARGVVQRFGSDEDPFVLSEVWVLVPTRRAIRTLKEAFERTSPTGVTALPKIYALGDLDEDPSPLQEDADENINLDELISPGLRPVISPLRRELLFTKLIQHWSIRQAEIHPEHSIGAERPALALQLARELARVLDLATSEGLSWEKLQSLVPVEHAQHWEQTLLFLSILTEAWPAELENENASDPATHRDMALREAARRWQENPPHHPVIAAGSTGSVPATAELLKTIAGLQEGAVVLPGIDLELDDDAWEVMGPGHPQHGMGQLLKKFEATREDVRMWTHGPMRPHRARLIAEALRPAETTPAWRSYVQDRRAEIEKGLDGLKSIVARSPGEEALAIACALREAIETPGKSAALVTPDRNLARRVANELKRWGISIDDSAGTPLAHTDAGRFLCLIADVVAERFAPVPLLAWLKHPLTGLSFDTRAQTRALSMELERKILRGPRPLPGIAGLRRRGDPKAPYFKVIDQLEHALGSFAAKAEGQDADLIDLLQLHRDAAELACDDLSEPDIRVWEGEAGQTALKLFDALLEAAAGLELRMDGADYAQFIRTVMDAVAVRPRFGLHPRLSILGPLEARLQQADLTILGGLNEGKWPPATDPGPWLNRPMRRDLDLSQPERRIGLSAHDFAQAASAPEVLLTRAEKDQGSPTTPSRWLTRLNILVDGAGLKDAFADTRLLDIARMIDRPPLTPKAIEPPAPTPPVAARPRELPVTDVERWVRDPYALYAKRVLDLKKLDAIDEAPGAADRGSVIHKALEHFVQRYPKELPADDEAMRQILELGRAAFGELLEQPGVRSIWWPRFERVAQWFLEWEKGRRASGARVFAEQRGETSFEAPGGTFRLTAKADRIEMLPDGTAVIGDYKTGSPPSAKQVRLGFNPQLTLEGAIALAGGFPGLQPTSVQSLVFAALKGGEKGGEEKAIKFDDMTTDQAINDAFERFKAFVAAFDKPDMPYLSKPHVLFQSSIGDYDHLARVKEWASESDE
ncbi:MAG: double-strand break repair protein AddB [Micropepsaceae bacterium]